MLRAALVLCWIALSAACTSAASVAQDHLPDAAYQADPSGIRYVNAAGTSQAFVSHGMMYLGPTESEAVRLHHQMREAHTDSLQVSGCADETFLCTRAGHWVFAVPRAGATVGQTYTAQGMRFLIDSCDAPACSIANINATCEHFENGACSLSANATDRVVITRFGFDKSKGITWIAPLGAGDDRYVLVGERGLLAPS